MLPDDPYFVYCITNTMDNSKYIGITNNIVRRKQEQLNNSSNKYLNAAIKTYGKDKFSFDIIHQCTLSTVDDIEKEYIKTYKLKGVHLYNISKGGLIGNGMPGEDHWNAGLTEQDVINIRILYASDKLTQRAIAELFNVNYKHISRIVRGERWADTSGPITLIKQQVSKVAPRRKLTDDQVIAIRSEARDLYLINKNLSVPSLADKYNIARNNMRKLLRGEVYANLSGPLLGKDYYKEFGRGKSS